MATKKKATTTKKKGPGRPKKEVVHVKKPQGGRLKKDVQKDILEFVIDLKMEGREISCRDLAKAKDISPNTAANYIKKAAKEVIKRKPFDYEEEREELRMIHQRLKRRCLHWLDVAEEENNPLADKAFIKETKDTLTEYTKFLEDWEYKQKAADRVEVTADITQKQMVFNLVVPEKAK